jgi:hypothetical protein
VYRARYRRQLALTSATGAGFGFNFPFVAIAPDGVYTLKKGTPLVQVIPLRRADATLEASIRAENEQEGEEREHIRRSTHAGEGWYKRHARAAR